MVPPINCTCTWTRKARTGWVRVHHTVGCPVHGADHLPAETEGTSTARMVFDAAHRAGFTVQDLYDAAAACIEAHTDPQTTLMVRIGWRNNLQQIHVQPGPR